MKYIIKNMIRMLLLPVSIVILIHTAIVTAGMTFLSEREDWAFWIDFNVELVADLLPFCKKPLERLND